MISLLLLNVMVVPGSVIGMVLLFLALHYKVVPMKSVEEVGTWLTNNMGIFFVPAGVGLMANFDTLADTWWQLLLMIVVTTALMMAFVGKVVQTMKRKFDKKTLLNMEHHLEERKGGDTHVK
nr:CidA/LrgA family protein [Vagococcus fluvialis]